MNRDRLKPHKAPLGQNFLTDAGAAERIISALGDLRDRLVIEVGPGRGALTTKLAAAAGHLLAIELDAALAVDLQAQYKDNPSVTVQSSNFLTTDLTALVHERLGADGKALLVGNLPYYITSDILLHLVEYAAVIDTAVVMMQREVGERVAAQPGSRDFGLLTVTVQMAASVESIFTLPPEAFSPRPQVFSSVLRLMMRPRYTELNVDRAAFERFARQAFAQKRKTLANNLKAAGYSSAAIATAVEWESIAADVRAEALSVEQLAALHRSLREKK
jgi:16S rRNA (adenine1518-N6/adenine1519-N6)-dimethyltransferase